MGRRRDRRRRRPLPGEGSDRLGSNFDDGLSAGDPEETLNISINTGILGDYVNELQALAVAYRRNLERGHLQVRESVSLYLGLPYLRAFWPFTSVDESRIVYDLSGQGRALTVNGAPTFGLSTMLTLLAPAVSFGTSNPNRFFQRADENGLNWSGLSSFMVLAWVRMQAGSSADVFLPVISKGDESTGLEYAVQIHDGSGRVKVSAGDEAYTAPESRATVNAAWNFVAAGYDGTNDQFRVFINGWYNTVLGGSPTLAATTEPFYVGRHDNGATVTRWRGEMSMIGFYSGMLTQEQLENVYEGTRHLFGA